MEQEDGATNGTEHIVTTRCDIGGTRNKSEVSEILLPSQLGIGLGI